MSRLSVAALVSLLALAAPGLSASSPVRAEDAAKPSPWDSPEATSGTPLPKRTPMNKKARALFDDAMNAALKAKEGKEAEALATLKKARAADPRSYEVLYALGVLSDRAGSTKDAMRYYREALKEQPDHEQSLAGLVAIHRRQGQNEQARSLVESYARKWERNVEIQALYADMLTAEGRADAAMEVARKGLRRDEKNVSAMLALVRANLRLGRVELVDSILEQAIAIDDGRAELYYYRGLRHLAEQRQAEALADFRRAVQADREFPEARMQLGQLLLAGGNYEEALKELRVAERLIPSVVEVQLALGDANRCAGKWELAKASLDRALRMKPDLAEAHYNLGLMYMQAGEQFPGLDLLGALRKAKEELATYRSMMGSRLSREDPSTDFLDDVEKRIVREQRRLEREQKAKERAANQKEAG